MVDSLISKSHHTFPTRESATDLLQGILDEGLIKSIGRSRSFEDGSQLFYWVENLQTTKKDMADIANSRTRVRTVPISCDESYTRLEPVSRMIPST